MNPNRRLLRSVTIAAALPMLVYIVQATAAEPNELIGRWSLENPRDYHRLRGVREIEFNTDGSVLLWQGNSLVRRRWSLAGDRLLLTDLPRPPTEFRILDFDAARGVVRLQDRALRRHQDVSLSRSR